MGAEKSTGEPEAHNREEVEGRDPFHRASSADSEALQHWHLTQATLIRPAAMSSALSFAVRVALGVGSTAAMRAVSIAAPLKLPTWEALS